MPDAPRPLRDTRVAHLAAALGVTRIARVTGLDRTGVEVASAIRPGGHVLQVTNGKGPSRADAVRGALLEAAELWGAETPDPASTAGPETEAALVARSPEDVMVLGPGALDPDGGGGSRDDAVGLRLTWRAAEGLLGARRAWVPEAAVHCPPPGGPGLGLAPIRWTSNGMGAHPDRMAALLHALLELAERDLLARALPEGFTERDLARRMIDPATLPPRTAALATRLRERGFAVHLVDVGPGQGDAARSGRRDTPVAAALPAAAALLVDLRGGAVPVAAGYACRLDPDAALSAALLEACQSRATEIHGAREDVLHGDRTAGEPLAAMCAAIRPRRRVSDLPSVRAGNAAAGVRAVLRRLAAAGVSRAAAVDLPAPPGLAVVKVVAPGLRVSELL